ncbi:uridylate kinase [Candidatus Phycorickettsia trachydisci]|uniref:Uridylate kinase n=1 Tax=Candidatus Phycorickettsia trachydisci TaxID=2115978 RepID=A0A2P1P762_9RICK|nr:UMP kinase [Candidatus Phycorickettsia trachydisci]AVP87085.1 uridylate kinase [Candidatus Phycorickettsia trachydisci]
MRVLLKLSGESLMGQRQFGHDIDFIQSIAQDIKTVVDKKVQICIVVGGGNIYRGEQAAAFGMERVTADYIGMLGTIINALALQNILERIGLSTRVLSAIPMSTICEPYIKRKAQRHLEKGRVVIFAAGSGNPFFTTDTAAVLRAVEMNCDVLLKATKIDGVYSADPVKNPNATRFEKLTYQKVLEDNLRIMDMAAIGLAKENCLPIIVFSIKNQNSLSNVLDNKGKFTKIFEER